MKRCSVSLAITEVQIKTTMRYHFTRVRMAIINKATNSKYWRGCGEKGTLVHCSWECRLVQPLWKTVWNFLRKLKMELPFDPAILLGNALPGFRSCKPPWLRLSERPWDHNPLRRQSLSPWQGCCLCPLYFTLLGPEPDQLASDG